jgi:multidrug resistance efflux pump
VAVVDGQSVQEGDVLARLDTGAADLSVAQADASLSQAQAALVQAQSSLDKLRRGSSLESARIEVERAKNSRWAQQAQRDAICGAAERKMAQQVDCDAAQANVQASDQAVALAEQSLAAEQANHPDDLSAAEAQVAQARQGLAQSRLARDEAVRDRAATDLVAPFAGTVSQLAVAEGVRVAPGSPVLSLVMTRPLRFATTNLSERNVGDIEPGAPATVSLTSFPDDTLEATVQRIAPEGTTDEGGAQVFTVYLDLAPTDLALRAGMTGRAEIRVGEQ